MNQPQPIDLPEKWKSNPWIQECLSRMERFSNDPLKVEEYEEAEKALLIYTTDLEWKHREGVAEGVEIVIKQGMEQGMEQGMKQGVEQGIQQLVQTQYQNGLDPESIAQFSNLPLEQVKTLLGLTSS